MNPRITETTTTLPDTNQVSKQTFSYDQCSGCNSFYNNQTDVYEYDFGIGAPGPIVRRTHTDYVTSASYTDAASGAHIRSLPSQASVYDANGIERARTTFEYDNYSADGGNHAGIIDRPSISGFASGFTISYTTRGNTTGATHYLLNSSGSIVGSVSAYAQYDIAGNVVKALDARGYATTFDFSDRFGSPDGEARSNSGASELGGQSTYAFPTLVTNALGQTAYTQFDFYLGRAVDAEDANGIVSSAYFNDALDRPMQGIRAVNGGSTTKSQTTFAYDDASHIVTTTGDQATYGDNLLKSQAIYEGLGRTTETRQYEGGSNYIAMQMQYDSLGRAYKTSNPFRPWNSESAIWTTTGFDALGRMISVTTPDSAVVSTSYSGNTVTVTDQAGKQRKSVTDGLGRLIQVYEAPNSLNYLTNYSYDTLDNLTGVSQVDPITGYNQTRSFSYDSLKRLTSAWNPESNTISYQYDNNGNLAQKTDARGVVSTYGYDALNRNSSISYSDGTPTVGRVYDGAIPNGTGRLYYNYTWSANDSTKTYTRIDAYDASGRVKDLKQHFWLNGNWTTAYAMTANYDLAGHETSMTYPSGRVVNYTYDAAGRSNSFSGTLGDSTSRNYSTGISYSSLGGMSQEQLGTTTPIYNKLFYNSRGQLAEIREGLAATIQLRSLRQSDTRSGEYLWQRDS